MSNWCGGLPPQPSHKEEKKKGGKSGSSLGQRKDRIFFGGAISPTLNLSRLSPEELKFRPVEIALKIVPRHIRSLAEQVIKIGPGPAPSTSEVSSTSVFSPPSSKVPPPTPHDTPSTPSPQQSSEGPPSTTHDAPSTPSPPPSSEAPPLTPPGTPSSQSLTALSKGPTSTPPGTPSSQSPTPPSKAPLSTPPDIPNTSSPLSPPPAYPSIPWEISNTAEWYSFPPQPPPPSVEDEKEKKKKKRKKKMPQPPPPKPPSPCFSECEDEVETKLGEGVTMPSIFAMCHIPASRQGISEPDTYQVSKDRSGAGSSSWRDEDDDPNFPPAVPSCTRLKDIVRFFGNKIDARNIVEVGPHGWHASSIASATLETR